MNRVFYWMLGGWSVLFSTTPSQAQQAAPVVKTAKSGAWSAAATWEGGKVPAAGSKVHVRAGHHVTYDVHSDQVIRPLHLDGVLQFAHDRDTRLEVGLIRVQAGGTTDEEGFDCDAHVGGPGSAALLVGTPEQPIDAKHTAVIRLHYQEGMNRE